ncbi:hypothetical protein Tco_0268096 [Tanacetum coccineum]
MMRLKYTDGSPITDHLNAFQGIINQLAGMGIKFEDEIQGLWLLGTLPDTWETFRTSLSNSAPDGVIIMELAKGSILNEETRKKSQVLLHSQMYWVTERWRFPFVCYDYDMVNLANDDSSWILDSGATMGNTGLSRIAGIGDICLKFDTGMELVLHNVKHVLDMRLNIISTGLL